MIPSPTISIDDRRMFVAVLADDNGVPMVVEIRPRVVDRRDRNLVLAVHVVARRRTGGTERFIASANHDAILSVARRGSIRAGARAL